MPFVQVFRLLVRVCGFGIERGVDRVMSLVLRQGRAAKARGTRVMA